MMAIMSQMMDREVRVVRAMQLVVCSTLIVVGVTAIVGHIPPQSAANNIIHMNPDIAVAFIIGAVAMMMKEGSRMMMYMGVIIGMAYMFTVHAEPPSLITGVCTALWGVGIAEKKERFCAWGILLLILTAVVGYFVNVSFMYGEIFKISTAMSPLVILLFFIIGLYMLRLSRSRRAI